LITCSCQNVVYTMMLNAFWTIFRPTTNLWSVKLQTV